MPQHGAPLEGPAIGRFFDGAESLACGIDRFDPHDYLLPTRLIEPRAPGR